MQRDHHRWYSHRLDRFPFIDSQCQTPGIPITWTTGGPEGGHDWPYWHHQMWEYVGAHF
jgi:S-formylglutathione hydrolase FrmB